MLRHAIFVLVLVGAAFAGGAAINGPGLAWLQHNVIGGPTVIVDGSAPAGDAGRAAKKFPSAGLPPLTVATSPKSTPPPKQVAPSSTADEPPAGLPPGSLASPAARLLQLPEPTNPDLAAVAARPALAPAQPPSAMAGDSSLLPPLDLPPDTAAKADPVARLASTTGDLDPASAPAPGSTRDWTEVRRRLKGLGVSRYSIDAETGGRVRFSCVIPMDGLRAVGHHFEADGDDEFQAVEATIRRVTLWRATEPGRGEP